MSAINDNSITATNKKLRDLLVGIREGSLIPRPEFQRRLVWTNRDKQKFLDTVLNRYPFPEIYIAAGEVDLDTGRATELLVDGQQRLTTLNQYFTGSLDIRLGKIPTYATLPPDEKRDFLEYNVVVRYIGLLSEEQIKEVFQRINSTSYSLNAMEIQNARYAGELLRFAERVADLPFFEDHRIFSANEMRRMLDVRFCLTLITTMMLSYFNREDELEDFLRRYNDSFEESEQVKEAIDRVIAFIEACSFVNISAVWKRANLFTVFIEVHRLIVLQGSSVDPEEVSGRLKRFFLGFDVFDDGYPKVIKPDEYASYQKASIQGTNDRGSRIIRGNVVRKILADAVGPTRTELA